MIFFRMDNSKNEYVDMIHVRIFFFIAHKECEIAIASSPSHRWTRDEGNAISWLVYFHLLLLSDVVVVLFTSLFASGNMQKNFAPEEYNRIF